jgi:glycosyltransferase involved in cell wall biosynthesis
MSVVDQKPLIVHGLWIGPKLSPLELLTLNSFVRWGHEFNLWLYDPPETPLPAGVHPRDATRILPRERIFRKRMRDPETGVGKGSVSPFSDLFRYKLLYELGGVWVDMDVTCLRPFNFDNEYVFRRHRLGVVGNLMKCPKGSELMRACYEECEPIASETVDWLAQVRILNDNVARLGLGRFARDDISNKDSWRESLCQFLLLDTPIPDHWYAIHWMSEFLGTVLRDQGHYLGRRLTENIPDKNNPPAGSTLYKLYRDYGLIAQEIEVEHISPPRSDAVPNKHSTIRSRCRAGAQLNVVIPTLVRGGAERTVVETVGALATQAGVHSLVFVMGPSTKQYALNPGARTRVQMFAGNWSREDFLEIARQTLASPTPILFTHLIRARHLATLWEFGVMTAPVIHNASLGWLDPPTVYNHPNVPFVVAVADAVARQLGESGCRKPIVTIRHELQRWWTREEMSRARRQIRDAHGVTDDILLIGMVGQFKSQKAYTRAVRVLFEVRRTHNAKLIILGDWDHEYGSGRIAHAATLRLATELGLVDNLILPGNVDQAHLYFGAFDLYLNTSIYEGLSIALLEAAQAGCPIVAADAGGNREALPDDAILVEDPSDIAAYTEAVLRVSGRQACQPRASQVMPDLIPRLWAMLAKHGINTVRSHAAQGSGTLFVTESLASSGQTRALIKLISKLPSTMRTALCILRRGPGWAQRAETFDGKLPILNLADRPGLLEQVEHMLLWFDQLNMRTICFWDARPEVKLLSSKILSVRDVRLVDVSPGPIFFEQLDAAEPFQRRIALSGDAYTSRLDDFVAPTSDCAPQGPSQPRRLSFIPPGVELPPTFEPTPLLTDLLNPPLTLGTCCATASDTVIAFFSEMMALVREQLPRASLTIVTEGGAHDLARWCVQSDQERTYNSDAIHFVETNDGVAPLMAKMQVFVAVSEPSGYTNTSLLDAMSMALPVVATASGGFEEQVEDGVTGYLIDDPRSMASRVVELLQDPLRRVAFGKAGRSRAGARFALDRMVQRYVALLAQE